jgi:hypothetical protein
MTAVELGRAGLQGWRAKLADVAGPAVARNTAFTDEQVKAAIGGLFFALAVVYVVRAVVEFVRRT